jgi:hypothetical protein
LELVLDYLKCKNHIFAYFSYKTMLLRRVSNVNGFELQAVTLQVDPHGRLLCLFNPDRLEFVLLEIPQIYKHFLEYRYE